MMFLPARYRGCLRSLPCWAKGRQATARVQAYQVRRDGESLVYARAGMKADAATLVALKCCINSDIAPEYTTLVCSTSTVTKDGSDPDRNSTA